MRRQSRWSPRALAAVLTTGAVLAAQLLVGSAVPTAADDGTTAGAGPGATSAKTRDQVIAEVRAELAESTEAMVLAAADLRLAEAALPGARHNAAVTKQLLAAAQRRQEAAADRRNSAQVQLVLAAQSAARLADQVSYQRHRVGALARAAYQGGGSMANLSMLLESRSPTDFAERVAAWRSVVSSQGAVLDGLAALQEEYGSREQALTRIRDTMATADAQARAELEAITRLEAAARAAEQQVTDLVLARRAAEQAAHAAASTEAQQGAVQQTESTSLQRELAAEARRRLGAAGARPGASVPVQPGTLSWPADGPVTSPFGIRVHPITGVRKLHTGTDLGVPCGTPVHVARSGTVIAAGWNTAYGYRTVVSHGVVGGALLTTTYTHQTHIDVQVGQQVTVGQVIGSSGTTGYSTGCHLHFELLVNADFVDPMPWMVPR